MPDDLDVWCLVVPDAYEGAITSHDRDAFAAARILADSVGAGLIALAPADAADYGNLGVDRLVPADDIGEFEDRLAVIRQLMRQHAPVHVVFPDTLIGGGHLGRQLAAGAGLTVATGVVRLKPGPEIVGRDLGARVEQILAPPRIVLIAPEAADDGKGARREAKHLPSPVLSHQEATVRIGERLQADPAAISLAEADFIVSAGTGVTDWERFGAVADRLQAAVGCTRAICDAGRLPRTLQVGASGTLVDPRCYLSFGISGAPHHLQGIARCERVVAVNTDLHAEMIKRAQLAIVADAQAVMTELLAVLRERM